MFVEVTLLVIISTDIGILVYDRTIIYSTIMAEFLVQLIAIEMNQTYHPNTIKIFSPNYTPGIGHVKESIDRNMDPFIDTSSLKNLAS